MQAVLTRIASFAVGLLAFLPCAHAMVGIPGEAGVSALGAAEYRIPIKVAPGTAGMEPKLALKYSSQGGAGMLGMGWSLEGLSGITRCPQTMATDGVRGSVRNDANDRFCMDGQRLINSNGMANYQGAGAEYRTEIESFTKVIAYETDSLGPKYFRAWTKAGLIIEYGQSNVFGAGSPITGRIERTNDTGAVIARVAWNVSRILDRFGNAMEFYYWNDLNVTHPYYVFYGGRYDFASASVSGFALGALATAHSNVVTLDFAVTPGGCNYADWKWSIMASGMYMMKNCSRSRKGSCCAVMMRVRALYQRSAPVMPRMSMEKNPFSTG